MVVWQSSERALAPVLGVWRTIDIYIIGTSVYDAAANDGAGAWMSFNLAVIGFVFALVGMVAVTIRAGGMAGVADRFTVLARSPRSVVNGCWASSSSSTITPIHSSWSTMRPLTDRMRVSRELAWLVDSTAAPVAGLSILSTWIAYEISQFEPQLPDAGFAAGSGFAVFLQTVPFRFCILTLLFVGAMSLSGQDFGPMLKAERRAYRTGAVFRPGARPMSAEGNLSAEPRPGVAHRAHVTLLPVAVTLATIITLFIRESDFGQIGAELTLSDLPEVLGGIEDNALLLFYGAGAGLAVAFLLAIVERLLSPRKPSKRPSRAPVRCGSPWGS